VGMQLTGGSVGIHSYLHGVWLVDSNDTENDREHVSLKDGFYFLIQILLLGGLFALLFKWFFQF